MKTYTIKAALAFLSLLLYSDVAAKVWHDPIVCETAKEIYCGNELWDLYTSHGTSKLEEYRCGSSYKGYKGYERVFYFQLTQARNVDVRLFGISTAEAGLDLFVMKDGCSVSNCYLASTNSGRQDEIISGFFLPGKYYIVVDGTGSMDARFNLSLLTCDQQVPVCSDAINLTCGVMVQGSTLDAQNNFHYNDYDCRDKNFTYAGNDRVYRIQKQNSRDKLQIHLFTEEDDLDIILVDICDGSRVSCLATGRSFWGGKYIDEAHGGYPAGEYFVIVDGLGAGSKGAYSLMVTCGSKELTDATEIICGADKTHGVLAEGKSNISMYSCGNQTSVGGIMGENIYYVDITESRKLKVVLSDYDKHAYVSLSLFGSNSVCMGGAKEVNGHLVLETDVVRGRYYIVVDGYKNTSYYLNISGCGCKPDAILTCGVPIEDNTFSAINKNKAVGSACSTWPMNLDAPDKTYQFTAPETRNYRFKLSNLESFLGLLVVEHCGDLSSCLGSSINKGEDNVSVFLTRGQTVYAIVDGMSHILKDEYTIEVICLDDFDSDGIIDGDDNCPYLANADQADLDKDGLGDVCDDDIDGDGVLNDADCDPRNAAIAVGVGQACDDGNANTINDRIDGSCNCVGQLDTDRDGVLDADDRCPNTVLGAVVNALGCTDNDGDLFFPDAIDASFDPDDNNPCIPNADRPGCEITRNEIELSISNATGSKGDTVCVDIAVTDFVDVAALSFSITIDPAVVCVTSLTNIGFTTGTFTGSGSVFSNMTGSGSATTGSGTGANGFITWTADPGTTLTLGDLAIIAELCLEIKTDEPIKSKVLIDSSLRPIEFLDIHAEEIPVLVSNGEISVEGAPGVMSAIEGAVTNTSGQRMNAVQVALTGDLTTNYMTSIEGKYHFDVPLNGDYTVTPQTIEEEPEYGLSLTDLLAFRKHFGFIESFTSPFQYIAADIDGNGKITIRDQQLLTQMILGMPDNLDTWRFVSAAHIFDAAAPFSIQGPIFDYPRALNIETMSEAMTQDFIAIRMGELATKVASSRSADVTQIWTDDKRVQAGQSLEVTLNINRKDMTAGILDLMTEGMDIQEMTASHGELSTSKYMDKMSVIWLGEATKEDVRLTMRVRIIKSGLLSDMLHLSKRSSVATTLISESSVELVFNSIEEEGLSITVGPNPFSDILSIELQSARPKPAEISIYNALGAMVYKRNVELTTGENSFRISAEDIGKSSGVFRLIVASEGQYRSQSIILTRQ